MNRRQRTKKTCKDNILPCPLCGNSDLRISTYGIECRKCGLWLGNGSRVTSLFGDVEKAWNTRRSNENE